MKRLKVNQNENATIYVIATPIGNLNEINERMIATLNQVDYILCEDTRVSLKLLNHLKIKDKKLESYHLHNEYGKLTKVIDKINEYHKVALLSDAGYPLISDPGYELIKHAIEKDINVIVVNGSNALLPALINSGFKTQPFTFIGFIPNKKNEAIEYLTTFKDYNHTIVLYESIHQLNKTLKSILDVFGNVPLSISRELTKLNEEHIFAFARELVEKDISLKGELVICIDNSETKEKEILNDDFIISKVNELLESNISKKDAIKKVSKQYGIEKNYIYNLVHTK